MFWDNQTNFRSTADAHHDDSSDSSSKSEDSDDSRYMYSSHDESDSDSSVSSSNSRTALGDSLDVSTFSCNSLQDNTSMDNESILVEALRELEKERAKRLKLEKTIASMKEHSHHHHRHHHTQERDEPRKSKRCHEKKRRRRKKATCHKPGKHTQNNDAQDIDHSYNDSLHINSNNKDDIPSRRQFAAMQQELKGYRQLVDAMTMGRPAMVAAANTTRRRHRYYQAHDDDDNEEDCNENINVNDLILPLHTVRFLELMPWHPHAQQAAVVVEELYEWQVYNPLKEAWSSQVANFPSFLQALPLVCPAWNHGRERDTYSDRPLSLPPTNDKVGVWTNDTISHRYELRDGYLIPSGPSTPRWKWIGGWSVDGPSQAEAQDANCKRDSEGWSYAKEAGHLLQSLMLMHPSSISHELEQISENHRRSSGKAQQILRHIPYLDKNSNNHDKCLSSTVVRRRKWFRKRVLVDYPHASEATLHFLTLLAQTEEMKLTLYMLHRQLVINKHALTDVERQYTADHQLWNDERRKLEQHIDDLQHQVKEHEISIQRHKGPSQAMFPSLYVPKKQASDKSKVKNFNRSENESDEEYNKDHSTDDSTIIDGEEEDDDEDAEDEQHCKSKGGPHKQMAVPSQIKMIERSEEPSRQSCRHSRNNSGSSFLMQWMLPHPIKQGQSDESVPTQTETESEVAPEVEPCSDDNSSYLSSTANEGVHEEKQRRRSSKTFLALSFFQPS